jgi:adenylate cyclase
LRDDPRGARRGAPLWVGVVTAGLVAAIVLGPARAPTGFLARSLGQLELWSLDARFVARGPQPATGEIVVVALDDRTLSEAPELLQKRAGVAAVVQAIKAAGARVIGLDILFAEPESPLDPALARDIAAVVDDDRGLADTPAPIAALLRRVRDETRGDDALATALRAARPVVLGLHATEHGDVLDPAVRRRARYGQVVPGEGPDAPRAAQLVGALPSLAVAAGALGLVSIDLDHDEVARRVAAARVHDDAVLVPLAVQVAAAQKGLSPAQVGYLPGRGIALGGDVVVATVGHSLQLNHRGKDAFAVISALDVVAGRHDGRLRDKAVLLGYTYLTHDVTPTPFDRSSPGVLVHATAVDNLLRNDPLRRSPPWLDGLMTLLAGLVATVLAGPGGPRRAVVRGVALVGVAVVVATIGLLALQQGLWLAVAGPLLAVALSSSTTMVVSYATEGQEKRHLRAAFSRYLAPELVAELVENPAMLALGGARRETTLLFSDIRGFTSVSETMTPEDLVRFLNTYLTPMTQAVLAERGFVDKYIGDAVMAVFGAPVATADHATRALSAALGMHRALLALRRSLRADLDCGVGLNSGDVVAGNMGSAERFDYTVIGDAVNLASRLEGLTKRYGVFCVVGERTVAAAGAGFSFRSLDLVRVKGRQQPVAIFELLSGPGHVVAAYHRLADFEAGVAAFRRGDLAAARVALTAFADENPDDVVALLYRERLAALAARGDEVPTGFDGVFDHTEK